MDDILQELNNIDNHILVMKSKVETFRNELSSLQSKRSGLVQKAANEMVESGCTSSDVGGIRWSVRNTPQSVIIKDEALIPPKFFKEKTTKSVNKTLIKSALKNGSTIQGVELSNGGITLAAKGITE